MTEIALEVTGLACRRAGRLVFAGLGFALRPGEALVVTGRNGAGKSTLLAALAGRVRPESGTIAFRGGATPLAESLHWLGHRDALKAQLTPAENLRFAAACLGAGRAEVMPPNWKLPRRHAEEPPQGASRSTHDSCASPDQVRGKLFETPAPQDDEVESFGRDPGISPALRRVGLAAAAHLPTAYLSAGQRRRLALARLLAAPRPLWLLDEPSSALDADGQALLDELMASHRASGGMIVAATHAPLPLPGAITLDLARPADAAP